MFAIRRATAADAGEVLTLQRAAFVTEAQLHDDVHMAPLTQTLDEIRSVIGTTPVFVAVDGHRAVGTARASALEDGWWQIGRVAVAPDRQGEGIGTALIRACEQAAPAGTAGFTIETGPKSVRNIELYERLGYLPAPNDSILIRLRKEFR